MSRIGIMISELAEAFRIFDKDCDGAITKEDLGTMMRNLGQCPSKEELQQILKDIDMNGEQLVSNSFSILRNNKNHFVCL